MVTSSLLGCNPIPGFTVYSSAKAMISFLAQGLHHELDGRIDVIRFEIGVVNTKFGEGEMFEKAEKPHKTAACGLRDVGHSDVTNGSFGHEFSGW